MQFQLWYSGRALNRVTISYHLFRSALIVEALSSFLFKLSNAALEVADFVIHARNPPRCYRHYNDSEQHDCGCNYAWPIALLAHRPTSHVATHRLLSPFGRGPR